jgi:hypothetical protein
MDWGQFAWTLLATAAGFWLGMYVGFKAYVAQRNHIAQHLDDLDRNVVELSKHMHDGRLTPDAVRAWIASIQMEFLPQRRRNQ